MSDTGWKNPGTCVDDDIIGTVAWSNPDNAKVSDDTYTRSVGRGGVTPNLKDNRVSIVKSDGSIGTQNKALGTWSSTESYVSYGGVDDLWGEAWVVEDVNDINFGVVLSVDSYYQDITLYSHYLKASNFSFSVPMGATIDGIEVEIERKFTWTFDQNADVDHIRIKVYYTAPTTTPVIGQKYALPAFRVVGIGGGPSDPT